jgi:hypothetical protein
MEIFFRVKGGRKLVSPWITVSVIVFGIIVAVVGVAAYLRLYKKSGWSPARPEEHIDDPPVSVLPSSDQTTAIDSTEDDIK